MMVRLREVQEAAEDALRRMAARAQTLDTLLDELRIAATSRTTSGVSVREEREYERNRRVHQGFAAEARTVLRLTDASVLGRLMTEATSRAGAQIDGPWWRVLPNNPARLEACQQAAVDARAKAQAFAEALGGRLGPIAWIRETAGEGYHDGPGPTYRARAMATSAGPGPDPDLGVEPGEST
jgi:uncharacterized protein YggE